MQIIYSLMYINSTHKTYIMFFSVSSLSIEYNRWIFIVIMRLLLLRVYYCTHRYKNRYSFSGLTSKNSEIRCQNQLVFSIINLRYSHLFLPTLMRFKIEGHIYIIHFAFCCKIICTKIFAIILTLCKEVITVRNVFHKMVYSRNWYRFKSSLRAVSENLSIANTFLSAIERVKSTKEKE